MIKLTFCPRYEHFDFNKERNANQLIKRVTNPMEDFAYLHVKSDGSVRSRQSGVIRTNGIDCLDRTNIVQCILARHNVQLILQVYNFIKMMKHLITLNFWKQMNELVI